MNLSRYQKEINKAFQGTSKNITVEAGPGSGKTTTMIQLTSFIPTYKKSIFLAFNKSIAKELSEKLPDTIQASTLHSYAMKILVKNYRIRVNVKENKTFILIRKHLNTNLRFKNERLKNSYYYNLTKLFDLYRMNLVQLNLESIISLSEQYDVEFEENQFDDFYNLVHIVDNYNKSINNESMIDFTDMLYLIKDLPKSSFIQYDIAFIDEAQDLNALQKLIVEKLVRMGGRFIAVGDRRQAIYAFQGSSLDCFEELMNKPNTINLPLSISYRCSKSVIREANKIFPNEHRIEAFEDNEEGEVRDGEISEIKEGDYVLCRNNKPLVELWLKLLKSGKSAHIYGKDYGENLFKLLDEVENLPEESIKDFFEQKLANLAEELTSYGIKNPTATPKYTHLLEKISILQILSDHYGSYKNLDKIISQLFSDEEKGITLMTCHKSKGLENERVFIYRKELIPSPYATSEKMMRAEKCLAFVAITRAKKSLIYISDKNTLNEKENS